MIPDFMSTDILWRTGLTVVPLAIVVALVCRWLPCRPSTRHAMWLTVLVSLVALPLLPRNDLFTSVLPINVASKAEHPSQPATLQPKEIAIPSVPPTPVSTTVETRFAPQDGAIDLEATTTAIVVDPSTPTSRGGDAVPSVPAPLRVFSTNTPGDVPAVIKSDPVISSPPIAGAVTAESWINSFQHWIARLWAVRDALLALTPIPPGVWLTGAVIIALALVIRIARFRIAVAGATEAPVAVRREVESVARTLGLRQIPRVLMVHRRMSPLIWCGRKCLLILPCELWEELDEAGRSAVVMHELAHLRRRDHWVCWAELLIGCIYWWNPVVWWIRSRLRTEADSCCDAWVTALFPHKRRAYATALLTTRRFANQSTVAGPVMGLGVSSSRTRQFARRITMVMTNQTKPGLSIVGAACALCLAVIGWLAAPLLACPPDSADTRTAPAGVVKLKAPRAVVTMPRTAVPSAPATDETTFETYMAQRDHRGEELAAIAQMHGEGDLRARIDELERRLERISKQLEQILGQQNSGGGRGAAGGGAFGGPGAAGGMGGGSTRAIAPAPPNPAAAPIPPSGPIARAAPAQAPGTGFAGTVVAQGNTDGQTISRFYKLSAGKREAFYQFMARSDVPLVVSQAKDGINIQATPQQHEVIMMFMDMVEPGSRNRADATINQTLPEIKRMAELTEFYETVTRNTAAKQAAAAAELHARHSDYGQRAMIEHSRQIRRQAEELRNAAEQQERHAAELKAKAQSMRDGDEKRSLIDMVAALSQHVIGLEEQADAQDQQADEIEAALDSMADDADSDPISADEDDEDGESGTAR